MGSSGKYEHNLNSGVVPISSLRNGFGKNPKAESESKEELPKGPSTLTRKGGARTEAVLLCAAILEMNETMLAWILKSSTKLPTWFPILIGFLSK